MFMNDNFKIEQLNCAQHKTIFSTLVNGHESSCHNQQLKQLQKTLHR